jgi:lipopolysaccharide export LptBFGC system permease protein LptF
MFTDDNKHVFMFALGISRFRVSSIIVFSASILVRLCCWVFHSVYTGGSFNEFKMNAN